MVRSQLARDVGATEDAGALMSLSWAAMSLSRVIAAPVGVALYTPGDIGVNGPVSAAACVLLLLVLLRLRERGGYLPSLSRYRERQGEGVG